MPAYTEFRNVIFALTYAAPATNLPIDAIFAASTSIRETEQKYAFNENEVVDLTNQRVVLTGRHPYQVHVFNLTLDISAGSYAYEYVETVPTVEDIS